MASAIDQVLQNQYATNLANEFPKFTWNNYFMITGTYNATLPPRVYTNLNDPLGPNNFHDNWAEWQLFRFWLQQDRKRYQDGFAGVFVDSALGYPWNSFGSSVERLGVRYVEFVPRDVNGQKLSARAVLTVTLTTNWNTSTASRDARISVLPIRNFTDTVHPANVFVQPQSTGSGTGYRFRVHNFGQCDRVALIVNDVGTTLNLVHDVVTEVNIPVVPATPNPCFLELLP